MIIKKQLKSKVFKIELPNPKKGKKAYNSKRSKRNIEFDDRDKNSGSEIVCNFKNPMVVVFFQRTTILYQK